MNMIYIRVDVLLVHFAEHANPMDADAIFILGTMYLEGDEELNINRDMSKAVKLLHRAAELGSAKANGYLGDMYYNEGYGVSQDKKKSWQYYELATLRGCANSRINLGVYENQSGNHGRGSSYQTLADWSKIWEH